jgi:hypothetical protein
MLYDIVLSRGCEEPPKFAPLLPLIPELAEPTFLARIIHDSSSNVRSPEFLGLDLPEDLAIDLLKALIDAEASAIRIASVYRRPQIKREQAMTLARQAFLAQQSTPRPIQPLAVACLPETKTCYWTCKVPSEQGDCWLHIDTVDGHLWSQEEIAHMKCEQDQLRFDSLYRRAREAQLPLLSWPELFQTYDIYRAQGCRTLPDLTAFFEQLLPTGCATRRENPARLSRSEGS